MAYVNYYNQAHSYQIQQGNQGAGYGPFSIVQIYWFVWLGVSLVFSFLIGKAMLQLTFCRRQVPADSRGYFR
ncbi:hypothetical protein [Desulfosporosinus sp. OT]|uniref:hypothetical protein n=1 Tax=Desulfosporosinus sp. OT TaxID=913865 RepID=UPI00058C43CC|nr:hypothetical protein [Desulfosporosinus sp. OT]